MKPLKETIIDWQRLCLNLRKSKPLAHIARDIGCDEQTINRLARGDIIEPRFTTGLQLLNMHYDLFPGQHRELIK